VIVPGSGGHRRERFRIPIAKEEHRERRPEPFRRCSDPAVSATAAENRSLALAALCGILARCVVAPTASRYVPAAMSFLRRHEDPAVCPGCGSPVGADDFCSSCGGDLRSYSDFPLRSEWEQDDRYPHVLEQVSEESRAQAVRERAERERQKESAAAEEPIRFELNPIAVAVALIGTAVIILGLFLPANENPGFGNVEQNTLIQQGLVVATVIVFGVVFAIDLARSYQRRRRPSWWELLLPISVFATTARLLGGSTLYPVVNGKADTSQPGTHAAAGTGIYAVLVGAAVAALGIAALRLWPGRQMRQCPACAELVPTEAKVCRYCGHRLEGDSGGGEIAPG
jgi:hypothetical protein